MDHDNRHFINNQLSILRVQLLLAKRSICSPQWRRHHFIPCYDKLYYISEGEGWIQVGSEQLWPKPGELVFIPGGTLQSYSVTDGTPFTKYWCHFKSNLDFTRLFQLFGIPKVVEAGRSTELQYYFQRLAESSSESGPATSIKIQSALLSIIAYFIDHAELNSKTEAAAASPRNLLETIHFIDSHLTEEISIQDLSEYAHFHPNYFIRMFKKHLGMTPMRYIHERRLEQAQQLLGSTDLSVTEIAYQSGFKDVSYFSQAFKKRNGLSPTEYRQGMYDVSFTTM
ncbi:helix-turn-helix domain-containing protein [Paenibacillus sp. HJL G12]|uniref:Helix-turn-helix domain-containing protein n=1 Tax=Paenibacillus dendrobii TaxID=2691084 RepID=A0A7X3IGZ9_9BACL|nr:AraC family transcriptional regulator [Paenibacillus dendrobii]MWV43286.1 helix-turn-helix domain-containing protein [Paenibacillus dendrobii]